jgi:hypothetical protein
MSTPNAFSVAQPMYAALGIATFPVRVTGDGRKVPCIKGWQNVGLKGSAALAEKFEQAEMFGFCLGPRSNVTVLDVDTPDERVLADALSRYGNSPLIIRTASGKFHVYYGHQGEGRLIRPFGKDLPIDILGGGFVVAPPSVAPNRHRYEIIRGRLEDILDLPTMRLDRATLIKARPRPGAQAVEGTRNNSLFTFCLHKAAGARTAEELLDMAMKENAGYAPPLGKTEVQKIVDSAWRYEIQDLNWAGKGGIVGISINEINELAYTNPDALALLAALKQCHHGRRGGSSGFVSFEPQGTRRVVTNSDSGHYTDPSDRNRRPIPSRVSLLPLLLV